MTTGFLDIQQQLCGQRARIVEHPLYEELGGLRQIQVFMEYHVFAVWDFMSLLKALQKQFGCYDMPWLPAEDPASRRFLNEIAISEEADADGRGGYQSHFEIYREAMMEAGASTMQIDRLLDHVRDGRAIESAISESTLPASVRSFLESTFEIIHRDDPAELAGAFLFGREDLLPDVFTEVIKQISRDCSGRLDRMVYYLERHIELDSTDHQPAARKLVESICGDCPTRWQRANEGAFRAYASRLILWDGALQRMSCESQPA